MVRILSSDIGRGHPYYLDGVREALAELGEERVVEADATVFEIARGVSWLAWRAARRAYVVAGRGGPVTRVYGALRRPSPGGSRGALVPRVLGGAALSRWAAEARIVLVDHPILVAALDRHPARWYQHGELVAPRAAIVPGAARVFVPTTEVADAFVRGGVPSRVVEVTGLSVDPPFAKSRAEHTAARRARLAGHEPLTFALFSSGAEPEPHVATLVAAAKSLGAAGHASIVFARRRGALERAVTRAAIFGPHAPELVSFSTRRDLDRATRARFARFDAYIGPPHERSSWALGLAVPALLVGPDIGPFAPENRALLLRAGVGRALSLEEAARLGSDLAGFGLRARLLEMCARSLEAPLDGFRHVARAVVAAAGRVTS